MHGGRTVQELQEEIALDQPIVSQQLAVLRHQGIVSAQKEGSSVRYALRDPLVGALLDVARRIFGNRLGTSTGLLRELRRDSRRGSASSAHPAGGLSWEIMPDLHPLSLDIIVATRNRADRLRLLLDSIRSAPRPDMLSVRVLVADNASTDDTAETVRSYPPIHGQPPLYLLESRLGQAFAHNRAIAALNADLAGFLDDDERIDDEWLPTVLEAFQDPDVGFISGPCKPDWGAPPPPWLPKSHLGVIGWVDAGPDVVEYGPEKTGMMMMGGNCVIRTSLIQRVGPFDEGLGRIGSTLTTGEDADYYERLLAAGARGLYLPRLAIYHYVPPDRLEKRYYRRWCFYRGISVARIHRVRPQPVKYLFGVPRYLFGDAVRAGTRLVRALFARPRDPELVFRNELPIWDLCGFMYGNLRSLRSGPARARPEDGPPGASGGR